MLTYVQQYNSRSKKNSDRSDRASLQGDQFVLLKDKSRNLSFFSSHLV